MVPWVYRLCVSNIDLTIGDFVSDFGNLFQVVSSSMVLEKVSFEHNEPKSEY